MSLEQILKNISSDPTDPKFLFNNVITQFQENINFLKTLEMRNSSLINSFPDITSVLPENKYFEISKKLSYLEVESKKNTSIKSLPSTIKNTEIKESLQKINSITNITSEVNGIQFNFDPSYVSLLSASMTNIVLESVLGSDDQDSFPTPNDVLFKTAINHIKNKKDAIKNSLGSDFNIILEPFLDYREFLEENSIFSVIQEIKLAEKFFVDTKIFKLPLSFFYFNGKRWSDYFLTTFKIKNETEINFKQLDYTEPFDSRIEELVVRYIGILNQTG